MARFSQSSSHQSRGTLSLCSLTLLRNLAAEFGRTPIQLFGSLKNLARRLLEAFRYFALSDEAFDHSRAGSIQVRFDTS